MGITIGGWVWIVIGVIFVIAGIALAIYNATQKSYGWAIALFLVCVLIGAACIIGAIVYSTTEAGKRAYKDQQSNFNGGISRTITVYDISGNIVKQYSGTFDVETDKPSYVLFDDENGHRHIIYNTTGTIIIDDN